MKVDAKTHAAVMIVLNKLADSYTKRDLAGLESIIAADPDVLMYGTGADEKRIGVAEIKAQAQRDWSQTEAAAIRYNWTLVSGTGTVAWAAADVTFKLKAGGQEMVFPGRMTATLEKRGERWLIVQSHFSFSTAGQSEGESFPTSN